MAQVKDACFEREQVKEHPDPCLMFVKDSAQKLVSRGIEQFKKGECSNAMNFYRQALELDNENVDALVARGALYNRSVFKKLSKILLNLKKA